MLNAKTAGIACSAEDKNSSPSTLRAFVALFCTQKRNKRRVRGWEVMDWQGVTNFEESKENYFGRILLPRRVGHDGEAGDEGERAGCGAGIKTPDKSSKRAGSLAGSQQGGGVVPSLQVMGWG